jgi:hypothetical protein
VQRAARILSYDELRVANLLAAQTRDLKHAVKVGAIARNWDESRPLLDQAMAAADCLLFAWGLLQGLSTSRAAAEQQITWLLDRAGALEHQTAWSVGADVRHPSRWHQYTADKHARTPGGTPDDRLRAALVNRPLLEYQPRRLPSTST